MLSVGVAQFGFVRMQKQCGAATTSQPAARCVQLEMHVHFHVHSVMYLHCCGAG
jgi:hypothetical protein